MIAAGLFDVTAAIVNAGSPNVLDGIVMALIVGMAVRTVSSAVTAPVAYIAVEACVAVMTVTPIPVMVTTPVDELTDATALLLDAHVNVPLLVETGGVKVNPAPR